MSTKSKPYSIWFHYNKPASRSAGKNVLTVHFRGSCHLVNHIVVSGIEVKTRSRKSQPRCVLACKGFVTISEDSNGIVTARIGRGSLGQN